MTDSTAWYDDLSDETKTWLREHDGQPLTMDIAMKLTEAGRTSAIGAGQDGDQAEWRIVELTDDEWELIRSRG